MTQFNIVCNYCRREVPSIPQFHPQSQDRNENYFGGYNSGFVERTNLPHSCQVCGDNPHDVVSRRMRLQEEAAKKLSNDSEIEP